MNTLLTTQEAADQLRVKRITILRMIGRGELSAITVGAKNEYRIRQEVIDRYLADHTVKPDEVKADA